MIPRAIETTGLGLEVRVNAVINGGGRYVSLHHELRRTAYRGGLPVPGAHPAIPPQPIFERRYINASQTLLPDRQMLLGTFNPPGANGLPGRSATERTWLVFVRVVPDRS